MPQTQTEQPLLLLQLSDPHLFADSGTSLQGVDTEASFRAVLGQALGEHPTAAALLLTGDLAQDESADAYRRLGQLLQATHLPAHLIPGNHDNTKLMQALDGGHVHTQRSARYGNWRLIMLDSQRPGSEGGHLSDHELRDLQAALNDDPDSHTLICLHHNAVDTGSAWLDTMTLDNSDALFGILDHHLQVRAVLWGHVHQQQEGRYGDIHLLGCPSTCFQFKPNCQDFTLDPIAPGYRWLRLFPDGSLETGIMRVSL